MTQAEKIAWNQARWKRILVGPLPRGTIVLGICGNAAIPTVMPILPAEHDEYILLGRQHQCTICETRPAGMV